MPGCLRNHFIVSQQTCVRHVLTFNISFIPFFLRLPVLYATMPSPSPIGGIGAADGTRGSSLWISSVVMVIVAGILVTVRCVHRKMRNILGTDDYLIMASLVFFRMTPGKAKGDRLIASIGHVRSLVCNGDQSRGEWIWSALQYTDLRTSHTSAQVVSFSFLALAILSGQAEALAGSTAPRSLTKSS